MTAMKRPSRAERRDASEDDDQGRRAADWVSVEAVGASEEIDIVVAQIKRLTRAASLEFALRVGAVIIHHFYDGNADNWRSRGRKTASFRRLAQHPELPLSPNALYRCVALFELCERLNAVSRWEHLSVSHLRLVLGLPRPKQEKLLSVANTERWTVKVLEREVLRERCGTRTRGGRRVEAPITKGLRAFHRCLSDWEEVVGGSDRLSSREVDQTLGMIEQTRGLLDRLACSLRAKSVNRQ
jgi:hypothetical protein